MLGFHGSMPGSGPDAVRAPVNVIASRRCRFKRADSPENDDDLGHDLGQTRPALFERDNALSG